MIRKFKEITNLSDVVPAIALTFKAMSIIRVPIFVTGVVVLVVTLPPQTSEIYRVISQDIWYTYVFRCAEDITSHSCPYFELLRESLLAYVLMLVVASCVWYSSRRLILEFCPSNINSKLKSKVLEYGSEVLAFAIIVSAAWGIYNSIPYRTNEMTAGTIKALSAHTAAADKGAGRFTPVDAESMIHVLEFLSLPKNIMISGSIILLLSAVGLFAFLLKAKNSDIFKYDRLITRIIWSALFVLILCFLIAPVKIAQFLGPIAIFCISVVCITIIISRLSAAAVRTGIPFIFLLVGWYALLSGTGVNNNHVVRGSHQFGELKVPANQAPIKEIIKSWYESRINRDKYVSVSQKYPLYIVAAQGGGIYAGYHAARVLSSFQDRCPTFRHHIFAISSVSGGSIGASVFSALLKHQDEYPEARVHPCEPESVTVRELLLRGNSLADATREILDKDLLSPLVLGLLFPELVQAVLPFPISQFDRARGLELALENSYEQYQREAMKDISGRAAPISNPFNAPFLQHWSPTASSPALVINTTDVETGRRKIMAPFVFGQDPDQFLPIWTGGALENVSLSTAALLSARFPWVTPSAWFTDRTGKTNYLVDGGYYDNSGLVTALELKQSIEGALSELQLSDKVLPKVIVLTGAVQPSGKVAGFNELFDPIRTMLNSWGARPLELIRQSDESLNDKQLKMNNMHIVRLRGALYNLPLGWRLSGGTIYLMNADDPVPGLCGEKRDAADSADWVDADCVLKELHRELL